MYELEEQVVFPRCPGNDCVQPAHSCWRNTLFLAIGFRPYHCMICFRRFHAFGWRWDFTRPALSGNGG